MIISPLDLYLYLYRGIIDMPIHLYKNSTDVQFWQHCMFLLAILLPSMLDECKGSACILWRLINQIIYKKNKKQKQLNRCPGE